ncbi:phosphatidylglycerol phosphatidylinositol transfer protein [Aspergillus sclerotialis]|uniref:Phosphatidylglycerol/phosphatidylinositol transfer protein n=1 Tax=Aspergillus sclerotialis TaxID=2070753 RepID=A0A3A3A5T6_9EURO|nr:phosphatidylglycerol phosphatidylinositol transfer protein [Aspergillus sclerotialis]
MKFASAAALLLLPLCTAAPSPSFFDTQSPIKVEHSSLPVHGNNPLTYCNDPSNYILKIENVDLSPNPPQAGQTLVIKAKGKLNETIERGATVRLTVKYGLITILNQQVNLCDEIKQVGLSCPLEKGEQTLTKSVDLPREIPPGKYSVRADVYDKNEKQVTCLEAENIEFKT